MHSGRLIGLVEEQGQRLQEQDVLALRGIALSQHSSLAYDLAVGLLGQLIQSRRWK